MMTVDTFLSDDPWGGTGVFAAAAITQGELLWRTDPVLDMVVTPESLEAMPERGRSFVLRYGYPHESGSGFWLNVDNGRFVNHSDDPNMVAVDDSGDMVAARHIPAGTMLTCDYRALDPDGVACGRFLAGLRAA